jgi:triosephosphate isomerase (TIM)
MGREGRTPVVVGNWKMELSHKGELELARALKRLLRLGGAAIDIVVCPSHPSLSAVWEVFRKDESVSVGAQNIHWDERGPQTGMVSVLQIAPFARWCIIGHSEIRAITGEDDDAVQQEMSLLLRHGLVPIVCIGESWAERESDKTIERVTAQMKILLNKLTRTMLAKIVVTYEPIWAISTQGPQRLPDPADVAGTMLLLRKLAAERFGGAAAERLRILYGGSVSPDNAAAFAREPGVDGVLVGSASLHPRKFADIVKAVCDAS